MWRALITIIAAITISGVALSFLLTFISIDMNEKGFSAKEIGFVHSVQHSAILVLGSFIPRLLARHNHANGYTMAATVAIAGVSIQAYADTIWMMLPARFLIGAAYSSFFIVVESWINSLAPNALRGRITAAYCSTLVAGFSLGSYLVAEVPLLKTMPYIFSCGLLAASAAMIWTVRGSKPHISHEEHGNLRAAFSAAPGIILIALVFGLCEIGLMSLLPIYGLKQGLAESDAAMMLTIFMIGGTITQIIIGFFSDRTDRMKLLFLCCFVGGLIALAIPETIMNKTALNITLFAWGGVVLSIYPLMMASIGHRFTGKMLAAATTAMMLMYGTGSLIGPALLGFVMDVFGANSMMYVLCAAFLIASLFPFIQNFQKSKGD